MKSVLWGFIGSLVVLAISLAWGYFSTNKELTVARVSHDIVISPSNQIDGISIYYNDEKITNLSKSVFVVENTGRVPIKNADVVLPLKIKVDNKVKVFDFILSNEEPSNLGVDLKKQKNEATFSVPLLNQGDKYYLDVLSDSSSAPDISASARIEGIKDVNVKNDKNENSTLRNVFLWGIFAASCFLFLIVIINFSEVKSQVKVKKSIKRKELKIPEKKEEIRQWVCDTFFFYSGKELRKLVVALEENVDERYEVKLNLIKHVTRNFSDAVAGSIILIVFSSAGWWYSLSNLNFG